MTKYYKKIHNKSKLKFRTGASATVPADFNDLSSQIISRCSFLQNQIQRVIYITHGPEILAANRALANFPNPKARMEFLTSFSYSEADPVVSLVFKYSRQLFLDIYELRNVLTHEQWMSCEDYNEAVLFSQLNEEARLMMTSGRLLHKADATSREVYDATIRYIQSVKIITCKDLRAAAKDADLCAWILMHITNVIDENDQQKKDEARRAFLLFRGTSHLFEEVNPKPETVSIQNLRSKTIRN